MAEPGSSWNDIDRVSGETQWLLIIVPTPLVGQDFQQQAMVHATVDDVHGR